MEKCIDLLESISSRVGLFLTEFDWNLVRYFTKLKFKLTLFDSEGNIILSRTNLGIFEDDVVLKHKIEIEELKDSGFKGFAEIEEFETFNKDFWKN